MERLAKRLKKEKIRVDVISFGEDDANVEKLTHFIDTLNGSGADQKESHTKWDQEERGQFKSSPFPW